MTPEASIPAEIRAKFDSYPEEARGQLEKLRRLILSVAEEHGLGRVEETLKWGEASYRVKGGSTIRIDWKAKDAEVVKMYFHCQTRLVETFKEIYREEFDYEGKRALLVPLNEPLNEGALGHCIALAMNYHSLTGC